MPLKATRKRAATESSATSLFDKLNMGGDTEESVLVAKDDEKQEEKKLCTDPGINNPFITMPRPKGDRGGRRGGGGGPRGGGSQGMRT